MLLIFIRIFAIESPFDKMEEEPEPEPEPEQTAGPAVCVVQGKKRKRKVVSKSVLGEDGFFCKSYFYLA